VCGDSNGLRSEIDDLKSENRKLESKINDLEGVREILAA
jgi:cell division protein FtsB